MKKCYNLQAPYSKFIQKSVMEYISYDLDVRYKFMKLRKVIGADVLILIQ